MAATESTATASELRAALADARRRVKDAKRALDDLQPLWLHPPMPEDEVPGIFEAALATLKAAEPLSEEPFGPFEVPFSASGLYFVTGPYYDDTADAQVDEMTLPPDGSHYYRVHYYWVELAPNPLDVPTPHIESDDAVWRGIDDDKDGEEVAAGLMYKGVTYADISDLVAKNTSPPEGRFREMVTNAETWGETQAAIVEFRRASAREKELEQELARSSDIVDLVVVLGDAAHTMFRHDGFLMPPGRAGTTVAHFLDRIGARPPESARVFIGAFELVDVDMDYQEFRRKLSETTQPAKILVVAPVQMTTVSAMLKRQNGEGPKMLHTVAAEIPIAVALLPDSEDLVLVYYDTGERMCDHVYPFDVGALSAEQLRTGRACPKCSD